MPAHAPFQEVSLMQAYLSFDGNCAEAFAFYGQCLGGKVTMPYGPQFWAKGFGMLEDKFGVPWMVNCEL